MVVHLTYRLAHCILVGAVTIVTTIAWMTIYRYRADKALQSTFIIIIYLCTITLLYTWLVDVIFKKFRLLARSSSFAIFLLIIDRATRMRNIVSRCRTGDYFSMMRPFSNVPHDKINSCMYHWLTYQFTMWQDSLLWFPCYIHYKYFLFFKGVNFAWVCMCISVK